MIDPKANAARGPGAPTMSIAQAGLVLAELGYDPQRGTQGMPEAERALVKEALQSINAHEAERLRIEARDARRAQMITLATILDRHIEFEHDGEILIARPEVKARIERLVKVAKVLDRTIAFDQDGHLLEARPSSGDK